MPFASVPADPSSRVLLLGMGGLGLRLLERFAEAKLMPQTASFLASASRATLRQPFFSSPESSWTTLETGSEPIVHRVLDEWALDGSHPRLVKTGPVESSKTIVSQTGPGVIAIADRNEVVWRRRPNEEQELEIGLARTTESLRLFFDDVFHRAETEPWRRMYLKLTLFDSFLLRLWHLLDLDAQPGGRRSWIEKTRSVFRTLDEHLGKLFELAARQSATIHWLSPYEFVPFRERIVVNELLWRKKLLFPSEGSIRFRYEAARFLQRQKHRWGWASPNQIPLAGHLPIDSRRSRAVALHGENAAFVYLLPSESGGRKGASVRDLTESRAEVIEVLRRAEHPVTGERLFQEVFSTAERWGIDPRAFGWPEVLGIPAPGYLVRWRFDRARQRVRPDPSISAARTNGGFFLRRVSGEPPQLLGNLDLSEAASLG